jgi:SAM-dependent methyltransferase
MSTFAAGPDDAASPSGPAGVRAPAGPGDDEYFELDRPELRARVPHTARRVLDVGCGAGALGAALKDERAHLEVVGLEGFAAAAAEAAGRLDAAVHVDLDTLPELPAGLGRFDCMIFGDVLEHLRDPARLLRALRPALEPGGVIVCSVPNVKHWSVIMPLLVQDRWEYKDSGLLDRTHVHFFTLEELGRMLVACGFTPTSVGASELPLPDTMTPLVTLAAAYGADKDETAARLSAYQYLVIAVRDDAG